MPPFPPVLFGLENGKVKTYVALKDFKGFINKEIIEINGIPVQTIINKLRDHTPGSDGFIESVRNETLLLNMTPLFCDVYNIKSGSIITYKFTDNTLTSFTCKELTREDIYLPEFQYSREDFRYKTSFLSDNIAYLKIKTFELFSTDKDSIRNFISKISKKNYPYLIIDLRGNKGGESFDLFGMLATKPYTDLLYSKVLKQNYNFFKYTYNYLPQMTDIFSDYQYNNDGYYFYKQSVLPVNDSINYKGLLYVLTDANSMSASTIFAGLVKMNQRGISIGQETGTTISQMNAVKFASVNIANTGLTMSMPLVKCVFYKTSKSDLSWGRGVIPDYPIDLKFEDFFSGNDRILNFTIDLIRKKEQGN
jgi:C-terminal processing protease CtpA/Prc